MHIVSENTAEDIARNRAAEDVQRALTELAANILRMIRGAGKPNEFLNHAFQLTEAMSEYKKAAGHFPDPVIFARMLLLDTREELFGRCSDDDRARDYAEQMIIRGALQVVASRMLHQLTIERAGDSEMSSGFYELERIREENRRSVRAQMKGQPKTRKARKQRIIQL
jgi:hypothetical protein